MPKPPVIEQNWRNVITARWKGVSAGFEAWVLLMSDNHHDSKFCERELEKQHLQMAKDRNAIVMMFGDVFDAMQGKFDPRRSLSEVRPEDARADYFDSIVEHAAEDYGPYAENIALIAKGNHETAVLDKTNTDLTSNLVYRLNAEHVKKNRVYCGCYGGWVRFMFSVHKTKGSSYNLKYHHGAGGNAPVTRGVIQTNRQMVFLPDADIIVNGHNHQGYVLPIARERLNSRGRVTKDVCWHVRTPGYHNGYGDGGSGYAVEKNGGPTPNGAVWLHFYLQGNYVKVKPVPEME